MLNTNSSVELVFYLTFTIAGWLWIIDWFLGPMNFKYKPVVRFLLGIVIPVLMLLLFGAFPRLR